MRPRLLHHHRRPSLQQTVIRRLAFDPRDGQTELVRRHVDDVEHVAGGHAVDEARRGSFGEGFVGVERAALDYVLHAHAVDVGRAVGYGAGWEGGVS